MKDFFKPRGRFLFFGLLLILMVGLAGWWLLTQLPSPDDEAFTSVKPFPQATTTPTVIVPAFPTFTAPAVPTVTPLPLPTAIPSPTAVVAPTPSPRPVVATVKLNPAHGIHAPIGFSWTDEQRRILASFTNAEGKAVAPGMVLAVSTDMRANNNSRGVRLEQDLKRFADSGSQVYLRIFPQRFPGGISEPFASFAGRNTISGTPDDAVDDMLRMLREQNERNGWHFTRLIPGNEPDIEWPNASYRQHPLSWTSNSDPRKYAALNSFYYAVWQAFEQRLALPENRAFRDVKLYFPALAQDADVNTPNYAGFNFYNAQRAVVGSRYDPLRPAIELYGRFTWHNYWQPGRACLDVAADGFPAWLKQGLANGWESAITEAGWAPTSLDLPAQHDSRAKIIQFWRGLRVQWETNMYLDDRPQYRTYDDTIDGVRFEDDLLKFVNGCHVRGLSLNQPVGVAAWLTGSEGNFFPGVRGGAGAGWQGAPLAQQLRRLQTLAAEPHLV